MTEHQLLEELRLADPAPAGAERPEAAWSSAVVLQALERRSGSMQTQERTEITQTVLSKSRGRGLRVAVVAFAAIVAIGGAAAIWGSFQDGSDTGSASSIGETMNQARITGDLEGLAGLYSDGATFTDVAENRSVSVMALVNPLVEARVDWDGDGTTTVLDRILGFAMTDYVVGVTQAHSCTQPDSATIVCEEVLQGHPFVSNPNGYRISNTYTVVDGLITEQVLDASPWGEAQWLDHKMDPARAWPYQQWVQVNQPELEAKLFSDDFAFLKVRPDTVETHRQFIAEWRASS